MTEVTELLAWRRGLAGTPARLQRLLAETAPGAHRDGVLHSMLHCERWAQQVLKRLLAGATQLADPEPGPEPGAGEDAAALFLDLRAVTLELLAGIDGSTLHRQGRLPSGRVLDPWRLAGELAELDVRHLAALRRGSGA